MTFKKIKYLIIVTTLAMFSVITGCLFEAVNQPHSAQPGEIIDINLVIKSNIVPEPNAHKGILGILAPSDWEFISADYSSSLGSGNLDISAEWKDSVDLYYPADQFGDNMKWIVLISDKGYAYNDTTSFEVNLKLKVGQTEGCFNLGYLTTKATSGLLSSKNPSWVPISFPHPIGVPNSNLCTTTYETRPAEEWDNLFDRNEGWTGADGIYSMALNGFDAPLNTSAGKQLILFSDTFIGEVDSNNQRHNAKLINNTLALLQSNNPNPDEIEFFWRKDSTNIPKAVFVPSTPNAKAGDWYWLMDGIALNDIIYVFALRLNSSGSGAFGFEVNGVVLLKFTMNEQNFISNVEQFDTPLFFKNETENWDIVLGQAVMPMTINSGNSSPDGYIYIYGPRSSAFGKELVAARVLPEKIENFDQWQYWNGNSWGSGIENCAPITNGISQEFSLSPIENGKYLLVFQMGSSVAIKIGESPVGPFGIFNSIYNCPEVLEDPDIFVYNAKAHPNLSNKDELLISYNVNTLDFGDHFTNADIYMPRFIYLKINDSTSTGIKDNVESLPDNYNLSQNYPNPFNPTTKIKYTIPTPPSSSPLAKGRSELQFVTLKIYDILGREVATLINEVKSPGNYEVTFDGGKLPSGIYFYRMQAGKFLDTKKLVFIK
ncbi:MAG: DUF4185 domain-containing protein [Ignavibacteriaceae bacterium]